ncbi:putative KHDC1-like protein [Choloepus didactylus]|uniref:putative KHDC1-like protein n=1 Tax=Choloepus didactylus TaxID=27675 RepID=UPI00189DA056|nr:putative KHDC1-like protein [Choloepus didactylus]XP_037700115.1 putative KHDC1-like protein [Choloepus didactylus]XP_037700116.1 putative KHDC1-like protein [Choloepus didactylus]XP_037700117.1 putative KHDC1-like protein [Choloepus didactylus]XP_037700118.1 putative KHDC1-like protein [Choloepus didactylus]
MATTEKTWWTVPENFKAPLVFYMEEDQEERIFGLSDADLHLIEVNSCTLIQLEGWFTATGQTRVTLVGPPKARRWLMQMVRNVESQDYHRQAQGLQMLRLVRSQPLTEEDLGVFPDLQMDFGDIALAARICGNLSLGGFSLLPFGWFF